MAAGFVKKLLLISLLIAPAANAAPQQYGDYAVAAENAAYSDIADLVTISPLIVDVKIRKTVKISPEQAIGVPANMQRFMVQADVIALIRGLNGVPARVRFVIDLPKDARGRSVKLKKKRFFILGDYVKNRPDQIQLARPDALIHFSQNNDNLLRMVTKEAVILDAPQKIIGVASAFHSPGTVVGEGNTQIFLKTEHNQPFSISITSRPGAPKQWSVSTSELIEESSSIPRRYSLLWYRLACGLPKNLPSSVVESGDDSANAARAQADYKIVIDALGPCGRTR